eukprot:UN04861
MKIHHPFLPPNNNHLSMMNILYQILVQSLKLFNMLQGNIEQIQHIVLYIIKMVKVIVRFHWEYFTTLYPHGIVHNG